MTRAGASIGFIAKGYAPPRNANIADAVSVPVGTHSDTENRGGVESRRHASQGLRLSLVPVRYRVALGTPRRAGVAPGPRDLINQAPGVLRGTEQTPGASHSRSYTRHSIQIARPVRPPVAGAAQADDGRTSVVRTYSNPDRFPTSSRGHPNCDRQTGCANAAVLIPMRRAGDSRRGGSQARTWTGCRITGRVPLPRRVCEPVHHALHNRVDALESHSRISKSVSRALSAKTRAATPNDNMPSVLDPETRRERWAGTSLAKGYRSL